MRVTTSVNPYNYSITNSQINSYTKIKSMDVINTNSVQVNRS
ncbi:hypothetical protein [Alkaliphilus sp. B6464]|nr:hypothetical protein [Alkaliphilus sp. B6464]